MAQATFSSADQALCLAVLKQLEVGSAKIDFELIATELNVPTKKAASMRWSRFNAKLKQGEAGSFSPADQELCLTALKQIEVGKIDYELVRTELGLPTKKAASMRWSRFNAKLKKGGNASPVKTSENDTPTTPSKAKAKGTPKSSAKKRKISTVDAEESASGEGMRDMDYQNGGGEAGLMDAFESPTRPSRRVKATDYAEGASDVENHENGEGGEGGDEFADAFESFGHGGSVEQKFKDLSGNEA